MFGSLAMVYEEENSVYTRELFVVYKGEWRSPGKSSNHRIVDNGSNHSRKIVSNNGTNKQEITLAQA